ncbi:MAG: hypothetical protein IPJ08_14190 [Burkholderiales bacterium]|nr:hypothetical protein [Burkholderiales bacterium]
MKLLLPSSMLLIPLLLLALISASHVHGRHRLGTLRTGRRCPGMVQALTAMAVDL